MKYQDFLKAKQSHVKPVGFDVDAGDINQRLFDWQAQVVKWALRRGRAALALPRRNCDVGTADEQDERFGRFCVEKRSGSCSGCPDAVGGLTVANGISECALVWAQMPYEAQEGAAK